MTYYSYLIDALTKHYLAKFISDLKLTLEFEC